MAALNYQTIGNPTEGAYKEKGSKFLAFAYPVANEAEIREHLTHLRKEYFDARHHCYAWILGPDKKAFRANDGGEPNHSAGDPIIGQIRSRNLTNVLVVVVRYFGGVKLGVGGLVSAYKIAAEDALNRATIITKEVFQHYCIEYDYVSTPEVMKLVKDFELQIQRQEFNAHCVMEGILPLRVRGKLLEKVELLNALGTSVKISTDDL